MYFPRIQHVWCECVQHKVCGSVAYAKPTLAEAYFWQKLYQNIRIPSFVKHKNRCLEGSSIKREITFQNNLSSIYVHPNTHVWREFIQNICSSWPHARAYGHFKKKETKLFLSSVYPIMDISTEISK